MLAANVLNSHFLGSAKEATLFAVDLQRTMIAVTYARDLAKKELATQTPEAYQADNCADDKQSDKSSTVEVSKMQTVDPKWLEFRYIAFTPSGSWRICSWGGTVRSA